MSAKHWENVSMQVRSLGTKVINQGADGDQWMTIGKLMDLKDNLYSQLFQALLYKKTVVYENLDLNSTVADKDSNVVYKSEKVVRMHDLLSEFKSGLGWVPDSLTYEPVGEETTGTFSVFETHEGSGGGGQDTESSKWLVALTEAYLDMGDVVAKNLNLPPEKIESFIQTNPVQRDLRQQVENLQIQYLKLKKEYDSSIDQLQKQDE